MSYFPAGAGRRLPQAMPPVLVALLCLLLGACATLGAPEPETVAAAQRAEQLYRGGEFERSAAEFLQLAHSHRGAAAAFYRLRAAEALREGGLLEQAAAALGGVTPRRLSGEEIDRFYLLRAEIALHDGDPEYARTLLERLQRGLPVTLETRALELRARAQRDAGKPLAAARTRAELDLLLQDPERSHNREDLIAILNSIDIAELHHETQALPAGDRLLPWIEQILRRRGQPLARELIQPERPVGTERPDASGRLEIEGYRPPRRVALLLPLDTSLASVAHSVRDGFLSAYFNSAPASRPELRIYPAGQTPESALAAYDAAVADGADRVVGPLLRDAVGALFHRSLSVPVLALNHPDTGEVPPPGSAEFGLLPEAEGAEVAARMLELGIHNTAIVVAEADWAARAALAFRTQFEASGGRVEGEVRLPTEGFNYAAATRELRGAVGADGPAGIFISMRPQQARLLLPQLRIAGFAARVLATSHIYSGLDNATLDRDLDGVEFCDAPWLFAPHPGLPDRELVESRLASANGAGARLFAFGMDAYALLPYLDWLLSHPQAYLDGATGDLSADAYGRIHRRVGWARFSAGIARPLDGSLSAQPLGE